MVVVRFDPLKKGNPRKCDFIKDMYKQEGREGKWARINNESRMMERQR